jgi:hypothetical protein
LTQDNKVNNDGENEGDDGDDKGFGDNKDNESTKEGGNQGQQDLLLTIWFNQNQSAQPCISL